MKELNVFNIYEKSEDYKIDKFFEKIDSNLKLNIDTKDTILDTEWIEIMTNTIQYLDNIFRAPNRFIINEEEIVKIELARKITVESIKHLSKNTNLIQDINEKTGDVRPSKILNINKEESYDTYENRVIYTLIQNMKVFIMKKKKYLGEITNLEKKEKRQLEYNSNLNICGENIDIKLQLNTSLDDSDKAKDEYKEIIQKINTLEEKIIDISSSEVYRILEKQHLSLITPPIKRTNVILKNVNFQYAMKLWNYLQDNLENKTTQIDESKNFSDNEEAKKIFDENFLLGYLSLNSINKEEETDEHTEELTKERLTNQLIDQIISLNGEMSQEEIMKLIGVKYQAAVERSSAKIRDVKEIFEKHIEKYLERLSE
jgi:hypothetical protein